ncbi:MAG: hypothetical protein AB8B79_03610 [Granulosicoccus sp.]
MIPETIDWIGVAKLLFAGWMGFAFSNWFRRRYGKRLLAPLQRHLRRREFEEVSLDSQKISTEWQSYFREDIEASLAGCSAYPRFKPILYLHGFLREGQGRVYWSSEKDPTIRFPVRLQTFLNYAFLEKNKMHVLVGVGGADSEVLKLTRDDADWQDTVWRLIDQVNVIILRPFHSPSVLEEFCHVLECAPEKLLLMMDPTDSDFDGEVTEDEVSESHFEVAGEIFDVASVWEGIRESVADLVSLPPYRMEGAFLGFEKDRNGLCVDVGDFTSGWITRQVELRGGFLQRCAEVSVESPGAEAWPVIIPVYFENFSEEDAEAEVMAKVQNENYLVSTLGREPTLAERAEQVAKVAQCRFRFVRWLEPTSDGNLPMA